MAKERVRKQFLYGYERILMIDSMIANGNYPSVDDFVRETGASVPTINRDLRDLRLKFGAEDILQYDRTRKGFYYTRPSFRIPALLTSEKQIIAAQLMSNLLNLIIFALSMISSLFMVVLFLKVYKSNSTSSTLCEVP